MMKVLPTLTVTLFSAVLAIQVSADLIPTPDLSGHPIPTSLLPGADSAWWSFADIALLSIALCLATYFAHVSRSRAKMLALTAASLLWFGFVRGGCVCPIGATQNVALAVFDSSYVIPVTAIVFFTLPLVFTLFFGRTFCAAVCPLGAVQELVAIRSSKVPQWLDHALGLFAYIYLGTAVILAATNTAFIICRFDPFVAFFRLSGSAPMLLFGGGLLLLGVFVGRPYCRYLCPYGAILRVLSRVSRWHVRIPPSDCIQCGLCETACPYGAIRAPTTLENAADRISGKRRLLLILSIAPFLVAAGAVLGSQLGEPLGRWNQKILLAEQLRQEELGLLSQTSKSVDAYHVAGYAPQDAYDLAAQLRSDYGWLGTWLGIWVASVLVAKLVQLSLRRRRVDFEPDRATCVACGRCYQSCPIEQVHLGMITDVAEVIPETKL